MSVQHDPTQSLINAQPDGNLSGNPAPVRFLNRLMTRRVIPVGNARTIVVRPRIPLWYKFLLALSLMLNVLILVLLVTFGAGAYRFYRALSREVSSLAAQSPSGERIMALQSDPNAAATYTIDTARHTVSEALGAVKGIEGATIRAHAPIDQQVPLQAEVSIEKNTVVTTRAPIPIVAPARITLPGGGGNLNATIALKLPAGLELPVHLALTAPATGTLPVKLDVPINIAVKDTELAGPFARLRRLLEPAAAFFGIREQ